MQSVKTNTCDMLSVVLICFIFLFFPSHPAQVQGASGSLKAGIAKVDITPPVGIRLGAGYGKQTEPPLSLGNHDPLFVRTLVLDVGGLRMAVIACDLTGYMNENIVVVAKERFDIPHILVCCSHTHSTPGYRDEKYSRTVEQAIVRGLGESVENMFPARIAAGRRRFPQLGYHRLRPQKDGHRRALWENPERIPYGPVDPEVGVIKIEDEQGDTRVILMNYACHSVVVMRNFEISADYPGAACRIVEEAYNSDAVCMFVQGGAGDINPLIMSPRKRKPEDVIDYGAIGKVGSLLAAEVLELSRSLRPSTQGVATLHIKEDALQFHGRFQADLTYDIHFTTVLINNEIAVASFPGEPFVKFQLDWKASSDVPHPFFFGYTVNGTVGDKPGYVPDIRSAAYGGYGADSSPNLMEVGAGEAIMNRHLENLYWLRGIMRKEPGPK